MDEIRHHVVETNGIRMHVAEQGSGPLVMLRHGFPGFREVVADLRTFVPNLRKSEILAGRGHWTQQERPAEVNEAMIEFLKGP